MVPPPRGGGRGGFGGRGGPGGRGGFRGGRGGGGRGGGRFEEGPPEEIFGAPSLDVVGLRGTEIGKFVQPCESEMLLEASTSEKVPCFNANIYLENKEAVGKVEEILGPINGYLFTVKTMPGVKAASFKKDDKFYISTERVLNQSRFLPQAPGAASRGRGGRGGRGGGRGGPGGRGGGRGGFRGAPRGGGGFRGGGGGFRGGRGGGFRGRGS